jgi:hypothetical protein
LNYMMSHLLFFTPGFDMFYVLVDWNILTRKITLPRLDSIQDSVLL